jgi:hypothetical protein
MEITKHIEIGEYRFEVTLRSKSTHAHSLMTDQREAFQFIIDATAKESIELNLPNLIEFHKEKSKG